MNLFLKDAFLYKTAALSLNDNGFDSILYSTTGLRVSTGAAVIFCKKSALFVDDRYSLAAKLSVDHDKFEILNLKREEIVKWIENNIPHSSRIAYDPWYFTHESADYFINKLKNYNFLKINLKSLLRTSTKKFDLDLYKTNERDDNLLCIANTMCLHNLDGYLICDACSISWLLGIRDLSNKYTPVVHGYLLINKNLEKILYLDNRYNKHEKFKSESEMINDISGLSRIGIDNLEMRASVEHKNFINIKNPCEARKSIKNEAEINDIKQASRKDSVAIINFLYWFHNSSEKITELDAVEKLLYLRKQQDGFVGESFKTISAADENAAMIHYSPTKETNKIIENILLIDSGGQYKNGTTDITRTISKSEPNYEQKFFYTLVLKGHIALANSKFPEGTSGSQLDPIARQFLQQHKKDYSHSTGHGIGYMSNVHEGPIAISKYNNIPLKAGMILSNEPGYYQENAFGIRLENMMLITQEKYLSFETISLVPFDCKFINKDMLTETEINWLKRYNENIIGLDLKDEVQNWLISEFSI